MGLLQRFFGSTGKVEKIRKAFHEGRWSDVLFDGEALCRDADPAIADELCEMIVQAGDRLATINLDEGEAFLRLGDFARAAEHFKLAFSQANSGDLKDKIEEASLRLGHYETTRFQKPPRVDSGSNHACGCTSSCGSETTLSIEGTFPEDIASNLELILQSYPSHLRQRYLSAPSAFIEAFLLLQEGELDKALEAFTSVPEGLRDDLFFFERGALLIRLDRYPDAIKDLEESVRMNPENTLPKETIVEAALASGDNRLAMSRLDDLLSGPSSFFAHSRYALLFSVNGNPDKALLHCLEALNICADDKEMLLLGASLKEAAGDDDGAEAMLSRLSGHGCSSAIALPLAEYYLRKGMSLDKALESFKAALRAEPQNPIWLYRIAQVYVAKGWKNEAQEFLRRLEKRADLTPELKAELLSALENFS